VGIGDRHVSDNAHLPCLGMLDRPFQGIRFAYDSQVDGPPQVAFLVFVCEVTAVP